MGFNDNSGDITLDAVLTDLGRELLARADGSFKITHFALGDDEIDYSLYDATASTGTESTSLRQLPIFEASTESLIGMKYGMKSLKDKNTLYLPVIKLNELQPGTAKHSAGYFAVCVDKDTEDFIFASGSVDGILGGEAPGDYNSFILLNQGLDTTAVSYKRQLSSDLFETGYVVELDRRFGSVVSVNALSAPTTLIDDDNKAYYDLSLNATPAGANSIAQASDFVQEINNTTDSKAMAIAGPRGTFARFKIASSEELSTQTFLFTELGGTMSSSALVAFGAADDLYFIDSIVRVMGKNTGYQIDIPVRFIKKI